MDSIALDSAKRLAAWLDANAKHMKYEEEAVQMRKAAQMLRFLDNEVSNNLESLAKAHEMLREIKCENTWNRKINRIKMGSVRKD